LVASRKQEFVPSYAGDFLRLLIEQCFKFCHRHGFAEQLALKAGTTERPIHSNFKHFQMTGVVPTAVTRIPEATGNLGRLCVVVDYVE
jgi:hypothetical protein